MTNDRDDKTCDLLQRRLWTQGLINPRFTQPEDVVAWLGAVQSQEFPVAKWSLGQRMVNGSETDLAQAFDDGRILRTHVLRPTWHFVARNDIRWLLAATAHRVHQLNASMYRQLDLDEELLASTLPILDKTLSDGVHRTRDELRVALEGAGIVASGMRLGYIVHYAELEGLICSGSVRGKQQTYALIDQRAPDAVRMDPDEALGELVLRYFTSHGPATIKDCAGWASLTLADVRKGIDLAGSALESEAIDGLRFWFGANGAVAHPCRSPHALLVQGYDEYIMGYFETREQMAGRDLFERSAQNPFLHVVLIDGVLAGRWKRTIRRSDVVVDVRPDRLLTRNEWKAIERAANVLGQFYGLPGTVVRH
jgi:hypothetical protein